MFTGQKYNEKDLKEMLLKIKQLMKIKPNIEKCLFILIMPFP